MKDLNERIIKARKTKNWTQLDLANALGVNVKNVSRWELGQATPSLEAAAELARVLDVSIDFLAGMKVKNATASEAAILLKIKNLAPDKKKAIEVIIEAL